MRPGSPEETRSGDILFWVLLLAPFKVGWDSRVSAQISGVSASEGEVLRDGFFAEVTQLFV